MIGEHLRAIAFRIVEIDGFADAGIGKARQSNALHRRMDRRAISLRVGIRKAVR